MEYRRNVKRETPGPGRRVLVADRFAVFLGRLMMVVQAL